MTYIPKNRGGGDTYHSPWQQTAYGSNSRNGAVLARAHGKRRLDIDATRTRDDVLINDHGKPLVSYFEPGTRSIMFDWAEVKTRTYVHDKSTYHPRTIAEALVDNAKHGTDSEVEIKYLGPISYKRLYAIMHQLALDAETAYGPEWRQHVVVKVLTNLAGGINYALEVCHAAHAVDLDTMLLVRGPYRFRFFRGHTEVTYVRGSAVIR